MKRVLCTSLLALVGCVAESPSSGSVNAGPGGKADGVCYGPETLVEVIPPQWPPSRIGDPIAPYLSDPSETSAHLDLGDGSNLSLWSENGRVYWEQRSYPDGRFENSFDQDRNGYVDDLRTGVSGCLEHRYRLSDEAASAQKARGTVSELPDASELLFPHAELRASRSFVIKWDADLERVDISFRVLWDELVPALPSHFVENMSEVRIPGNWTVDASEVEVLTDAAGFSIRVVNARQSNWGNAPILEVLAPSYAPEEISFFSPKFLSDDTLNQRDAAQQSLEAADSLIEYLKQEIAQAEEAIADPSARNAYFVDAIASAKAQVAEIDEDLDGLRQDLLTRWDAATQTEQAQAVAAIKGLTTDEQSQQLADLSNRLASAATKSSELAPESRDLALAGLLIVRDETSHPFYVLVEQRQLLLVFEIPDLQKQLDEHNTITVAGAQKRIEEFSASLDEWEATRRDNLAKLARLKRAPSLTFISSMHEPYTR